MVSLKPPRGELSPRRPGILSLVQRRPYQSHQFAIHGHHSNVHYAFVLYSAQRHRAAREDAPRPVNVKIESFHLSRFCFVPDTSAQALCWLSHPVLLHTYDFRISISRRGHCIKVRKRKIQDRCPALPTLKVRPFITPALDPQGRLISEG